MRSVYLDANIFKHSVRQRTREVREPQHIRWGPADVEVSVSQFIPFDPTEELSNSRQRTEAQLLASLSDHAQAGRIAFVSAIETMVEVWGLRDAQRDTRHFCGTPVRLIESPIQHSRILISGWARSRDLQLDFFGRIRHPRYEAFKRAFGAGSPNRNLLADLFFLWTAESAGIDYFLTMDERLIRAVKGQSQLRIGCKVALPSELLRDLER